MVDRNVECSLKVVVTIEHRLVEFVQIRCVAKIKMEFGAHYKRSMIHQRSNGFHGHSNHECVGESFVQLVLRGQIRLISQVGQGSDVVIDVLQAHDVADGLLPGGLDVLLSCTGGLFLPRVGSADFGVPQLVRVGLEGCHSALRHFGCRTSDWAVFPMWRGNINIGLVRSSKNAG